MSKKDSPIEIKIKSIVVFLVILNLVLPTVYAGEKEEAQTLLEAKILSQGLFGKINNHEMLNIKKVKQDLFAINAYTPAEIMAKIRPYLTRAYAINPNNPMKTSIGRDNVYIYKLPTDPPVYIYTSSASIDCDGQTTSACNKNTDPAYQDMTSFTQSNGKYLNAEQLPFYVLPVTPNPIFDYAKRNIYGGSAGLVMYNNAMEFGVFGDERGRDGDNREGLEIGEISYGMAKSLGNINPDPSEGGVSSGVTYLIFTTTTNVVSPIENHSKAELIGGNALNLMASQLTDGSQTGSCSYWRILSVRGGSALAEFNYDLFNMFFHFNMGPNTDGSLGYEEIADAAAAREFVQKAHDNNNLAILVVGGEGYAPGFQAATNNANRAKFVKQITERVTALGYDGITMDWEENVNNPNLIQTMKDLRTAFNELNPKPLLLIDWCCDVTQDSIKQIEPYVDSINTMDYQNNVENDYNTLISVGVPAPKIINGLGFYAYIESESRARSEVQFVIDHNMQGIEIWDSSEIKDASDPRLNPIRDLLGTGQVCRNGGDPAQLQTAQLQTAQLQTSSQGTFDNPDPYEYCLATDYKPYKKVGNWSFSAKWEGNNPVLKSQDSKSLCPNADQYFPGPFTWASNLNSLHCKNTGGNHDQYNMQANEAGFVYKRVDSDAPRCHVCAGSPSSGEVRLNIKQVCNGDKDGDGINIRLGDCNDSDPNNFPGNTEIFDRKDNDCDGQVDEGIPEDCYNPADEDRDGKINFADPDCNPDTNKSLCATNLSSSTAWLSVAPDTDSGNANYCCGNNEVSDCGNIIQLNGKSFVCDSQAKKWYNNTSIGVITPLECANSLHIVSNGSSWIACNGSSSPFLFFTKGGIIFQPDNKIRVRNLSNFYHDLLCFQPSSSEYQFKECYGNGAPFSGVAYSIRTGDTIPEGNPNPYLCLANASFWKKSMFVDRESCLSTPGGMWAGSLCCFSDVGDTFSDQDKGCWLGESSFQDKSKVQGTFDKVLYTTGSFYGCSYPFLSLNNYVYAYDLKQKTYEGSLQEETNFSLMKGGAAYTVKIKRFDTQNSATSYLSRFSSSLNIDGTSFGEGNVSVKTSLNPPGWIWQPIDDQQIIFEIFSSSVSVPNDLIVYYQKYAEDIIRGGLTLKILRIPSVKAGRPNAINSSLVPTQFIKRIDENQNVSYCENIGNYYCSPSNFWNSKNNPLKNYTHFSSIPWQDESSPKSDCCPETMCWDGGSCIDNEAGQGLDPAQLHGLDDDQNYTCVNGTWKRASFKTDWDGNPGSCANASDCFIFHPNEPDERFCVQNMTWIQDHLCIDGEWHSRTSKLAEIMASFVVQGENYTLFCDNYSNALNYVDYNLQTTYFIQNVKENLLKTYQGSKCGVTNDESILESNLYEPSECVNNMCVLWEEKGAQQQVFVGTSLNRHLPNTGLSYVLQDDWKFLNDPLLQPANLVIFKYNHPLPTRERVDLLDIFKNILTSITRIIQGREPTADILIDKNFNKLYLAKKGIKQVHAVSYFDNVEKQNVFSGEYDCFEKNLCQSLNLTSYKPTCKFDNVSVALEKKGGNAIPNSVWLNITAKLRLQDEGSRSGLKGNFSVSVLSGRKPLIVQVIPKSASCQSESITKLFNYGEPNAEYTSNTAHTYSTEGIYTITGNFSDEREYVMVASTPIIVYGYPSATLNISSPKPEYDLLEPFNVNYACTPSPPAGYASLLKCELNFGNGTTITLPSSSGQMPISFSKPGTYSLSILSTDTTSITNSSSPKIVNVVSPIIACGQNVQNGVDVLKLSSTSNAHLGDVSSSYPIAIKCNVSKGEFSSADKSALAYLSASFNAHIAVTNEIYQIPLQLGSVGGKHIRSYIANGCEQGDSCLVTVSSQTNAHAATCDDPNKYSNSLCLSVS